MVIARLRRMGLRRAFESQGSASDQRRTVTCTVLLTDGAHAVVPGKRA